MALFFDEVANFAKGQLPAIYDAAATTVVLDSIIAGIGQVTTNGTSTLTGVGTTFTNNFAPGDTITVQGETIRTIATVSSDLILTVTVPFVTSLTNLAYVIGGGARFPDPAIMGPTIGGPYNCVWWDQKTYPDPDDDPNKEIVRVTAKVGDTLTIIRAQEDTLATTKNSFGGLYAISNVLTKFVMDQIRGAIGSGGLVIEDNSVVQPSEPALNFRDYFTLSDTSGVRTNVDIDIAGLTSDSTFVTDVSTNISGLVSVAVDGTTITGDGTSGNPLVSHSTGGTGHIIEEHGTPFPDEPALNFRDFFTITDTSTVSTNVDIDVSALATDPTFISDLTSDSTFISDIQVISSNSGTINSTLFPTETVIAGDSMAITRTKFSSATTALPFGKITADQKANLVVFGSGLPMTTMKVSLKFT